MLILAFGVAVAPFIFSTTLERLAIVRGDTLLGGREALWQAASKLILEHPWSGVGIGNAPYAVLPYLRPLRSILGLDWASLHNPLLTIWAETGFVGLLFYLAVLGSAVWSFLRQYLHSRRLGEHFLTPYFALVCSAFIGYIFSWIKGGGMESDFSYFLMLALLTIPSHLNIDANAVKDNPER
jgi:putative inorganic carbon (hco3(-)) transporter